MRRHRSLMSRVLMGAAALLGLGQPIAGLGVARAATDWSPNSDDALLLDVRLGKYRLGEGVRGYATPNGGACVDMGDTVMALDLAIRVDKKLRRATGWAFEEKRSVAIDREAKTVQIMNTHSTLGANDIIDAPEGWCVDVKKLADWLGVKLNADQTNAILIVTADSKLPVELTMERRARAATIRAETTFDLKSLPQSKIAMKGISIPAVDVVLSAGGLRQPSKGQSGKGQSFNWSYEAYLAGEVGPVAYDARIAGNRLGAPRNVRLKAYRTDAEGKLFGPLKATQWAAGDVSGLSTPLVSQSGAGRGAFITNRPIVSPAAFDKTDFRGELPTGWDAELYRNGQLLGFAGNRADGRYEFLDVPLLYGQNRFEVVLYGPQGQIRREEKAVPVGLDSIPPRQTRYWAGINQIDHDLFGLSQSARANSGWRASLGLERGLNAKTSIAAYGQSMLTFDGVRRKFAELSVRRAVGPALVELSGASNLAGGLAYRAQMTGEFGKTNIQIESINAQGGYESDRLLEGVTGLHSLSLDRSVRLGRTSIPLHLDARYTTRTTGQNSMEAGLRSYFGLGRLALSTRLDWRHSQVPSGPSPPDELGATVLANARIGRVRLRSEGRFRILPNPEFDTMTIVAEWAGRHGSTEARSNNWRAEIGYDRSGRGRIGLGYVRQFNKFALTGSVEGATDGSVAAGLNLAFSLGPDPRRGGIRMTSDPLASNGQLLATVFRDLNGDGIRQAGEPGEKDVQLTAGRSPIEGLTDRNGQILVNKLPVFEPLLVGIDGSSMADPLVQPKGPGFVLTPRPGIIAKIELALVSAGEVDGTLAKAGGGSVEGVELELLDEEQRVVGRTQSEYDGFFLFEGVPYGRYTIRIAKLSADAARLSPRLNGIAVVGGKAPSAHLGTIKAESLVQNALNP
jgi:hypothetical protein